MKKATTNYFMNTQLINETDVIASRRSFLTRMAYGSLLAIGGSSIAEAAAKHVAHGATNKKVETKHADKPSKNTLHERVALKSKNAPNHSSKTTDAHHHLEHKELASNSHRVHNSLHKDRDGGHRLSDAREHLASHDSGHLRIHETLHKDIPHRNMPEFAFQEREFDEPRLQGDDLRDQFASTTSTNQTSNRFILPNRTRNNVTHKTLDLRNTTTGDNLNVTYFERGRYLPDALHEINYLYRDHLTDEVHPVDVALLDQLHDLQDTLGVKKSISVICGYRSPFTNAHLRRNSRGVAKNSLHMEGRAIDIRIAGIESRTVRDAALSMARGGVGYYPGSNFVHLDTGDFRTW
jgi:uncharacterized protein YcbK (DUF882 family)